MKKIKEISDLVIGSILEIALYIFLIGGALYAVATVLGVFAVPLLIVSSFFKTILKL